MRNRAPRSILVTPRSVDRCVATLRLQNEPDPHNPAFIHTIRDIGYRFEFWTYALTPHPHQKMRTG